MLECDSSWQARYLVMLEYGLSWHAQNLMLERHFSWQVQDLLMLECHFSWQAHYLVMSECHFSWQAHYWWCTFRGSSKMSWHHLTWCHTASHDMTWHLPSNHATSPHVTSQPPAVLHLTSQPTTKHHIPHHSTLHHQHRHCGNATSHHQNANTRRNGRRLVHTNTSVWASRWWIALRDSKGKFFLWHIVLFLWNFPPPACPALFVYSTVKLGISFDKLPQNWFFFWKIIKGPLEIRIFLEFRSP